MRAVIRAFGDDRLDTDLAAILKLLVSQEPTCPTHTPTTPLKSLRVSRRASATIVASLTFALLASAGLVLLKYQPDAGAGAIKGEQSVSALIPAAEVKALAETATATSMSSAVEHRHDRANAPIRWKQAYPTPASVAELASAPPSSVAEFAVADAPSEDSIGSAASTPTQGELAASPGPAGSTSDKPSATGEHDAMNTEAQLAAKRTRRDTVAAIRALRRQ